MLHSKHIKSVLESTLAPISINKLQFNAKPLQSSVILARDNGAIVSFANKEQNDSINNLKMMCLLIKDKWSEDESEPQQQSTSSCYSFEINQLSKTRIYTYEIEELHASVAQLPGSDLLLLFIADNSYPYGLLVMKMKNTIKSLDSLYGYKLD